MEQRFAFDPIANIYKAARPDYPEALIEAVVSYADLKQSDKILEVGCGTGQATKSSPSEISRFWQLNPDSKCCAARVRAWQALAMLTFWRPPSRHGPRHKKSLG